MENNIKICDIVGYRYNVLSEADTKLITQMEYLTKEEAIKRNLYFVLHYEDTHLGDILHLFAKHVGKTIYVTAADGRDYLVYPARFTPYLLSDDAKNNLFAYHCIGEKKNSKEIIHVCLDIGTLTAFTEQLADDGKKSKEIYDSKNKISIFLDRKNMAYWSKKALSTKVKYKGNKVDELPFTGIEYSNRIEQMIKVANDIMDGKLLPDIFDRIPLKKNGTFAKNRRIPIFKSGIAYGYG